MRPTRKKTIKNKWLMPFIVVVLLAGAAFSILSVTILTAQRLITPKAPQTMPIMIGDQIIKAEVVTTPLAFYRGLSRRPALGKGNGMLFDFGDKQPRDFVMRDMEFPLDIIFIADHQIVKIAADLPPEGPEPANIYSSDVPVDQVLEVNGGYCRERGIKVGDKVFSNQ